jgi:aminobenzoyl-glutamate utilization protein B
MGERRKRKERRRRPAAVISTTLVELAEDPEALRRCQAEFQERTGGGIGGTQWMAPLLGREFQAPVHFRWPEYVETVRGYEWTLPTPP